METKTLDIIFWTAMLLVVLASVWFFWDSSVWDECRAEGHSYAYCFDLLG